MIIFDIETNGLNPDKIHCLSYTRNGECFETLYKYDEMRKLVLSGEPLLGHNIIRYDIPVLEKILNIKIKSRLYDTLPMSWVMNPTRSKHGLDSFFLDFGIEKVKIDDWENLSLEDYQNRCVEDVRITKALWNNLLPRFIKVYKCKKMLDKFFRYLEFKMDCAKEAERQGWKLNVELAKSLSEGWTKLQEQKVAELIDVMPMKTNYRTQTRPKVYQKKDG